MRLQVLVPESLQRRILEAAERRRLSAGAWACEALERSLAEEQEPGAPLDRLSQLGAPTADIDQVLPEIDAGRR